MQNKKSSTELEHPLFQAPVLSEQFSARKIHRARYLWTLVPLGLDVIGKMPSSCSGATF